jgi:hypothetical protein
VRQYLVQPVVWRRRGVLQSSADSLARVATEDRASGRRGLHLRSLTEVDPPAASGSSSRPVAG